MSKKKKKKSSIVRAEFKKNREVRTRRSDLTREYHEKGHAEEDAASTERISGKGSLTRRRSISGAHSDEDETGMAVVLDVDESACLAGRVLRSGGLHSDVSTEDGTIYRCSVRRILKTLDTDQRHVVAAGDRVLFRPANESEGVIERVEPRRGVLSRTSRGRRHVIVANVDLILIISSAGEPGLKPNLIDRFLVTAEASKIRPVICINKIDLIDPASLQPLVGVYGRMGYEVLLLSVEDNIGIDRFDRLLRGSQSVVVGQSGVGKSSLLNMVDPELKLKINAVSAENQKGRHTTTAGQLIPLSCGGYVVDTPGIRQFQLWDVIPEEVGGFYRDIRPYVSQCRFPDCTHTHESNCAVKNAVGDGRLDLRRYESYCQVFAGDMI